GAHQQTLESGFRLKHGCSTVSALCADAPSPTRGEGKNCAKPSGIDPVHLPLVYLDHYAVA
ncbi:hypothetical protein, partial [Mesorhizobium sp.]|uniref:hypothetical protein n=1 Tax=Mesorhizobium sp. TaxID=1871066 RepID=UPI00257B0985